MMPAVQFERTTEAFDAIRKNGKEILFPSVGVKITKHDDVFAGKRGKATSMIMWQGNSVFHVHFATGEAWFWPEQLEFTK